MPVSIPTFFSSRIQSTCLVIPSVFLLVENFDDFFFFFLEMHFILEIEDFYPEFPAP